MFAHNGDLKNYAPRLHGAFRPVGTTDSERAFCWLMQELAKSHASVPGVAELSATLAELLPQVAAHGVFNAMLDNGQALWAHCSTQLHHIVRQHPFARASLQDEDVTVDFAAADVAARPRRGRRHRAVDEGRAVAGVRARRDAGVRRRRAVRSLTTGAGPGGGQPRMAAAEAETMQPAATRGQNAT